MAVLQVAVVAVDKYLMAKKINEFLRSLIAKAGGNADDEKIKTALTAIGADLELSDDVINAIDHGLISIDSAKGNHPEIKGHYFAAAYNGLDRELEGIFQEEKLPEEVIAELKKETSSTKRAGLLVRKIKELELSKQNGGKGKTEELNNQIAELQKQLRLEKDSINGIKVDYEKQLRAKDKNYAMRGLLSGYKTIHDKLDAETKGIIVNAIIEKNLRLKGYLLDTDQNGDLILTTKDGNQAFGEDHRPLTPKSFIDKMMADENLLEVTGNQNNGNNNQQNGQQRQQTPNGQFNNRQQFNGQNNNNGDKKPNHVLQSLIEQSQKDYNSGGDIF